jgi:hypothetical protein
MHRFSVKRTLCIMTISTVYGCRVVHRSDGRYSNFTRPLQKFKRFVWLLMLALASHWPNTSRGDARLMNPCVRPPRGSIHSCISFAKSNSNLSLTQFVERLGTTRSLKEQEKGEYLPTDLENSPLWLRVGVYHFLNRIVSRMEPARQATLPWQAPCYGAMFSY